MRMDKLIQIQVRDEETESWKPFKKTLASINSSRSEESYGKGAEQMVNTLVFTVRYLPYLEALRTDGTYRIVYKNVVYNIIGYDDFFESHQTVKLTGVSYGDTYEPR